MAAFQLKNFVSIVAGMINHVRATQTKITDFNIGAIFRTLIEAVGIELDQLYQQLFNGLMAAIPVATYNSFSFPLLSASEASGLISVQVADSISPTVFPVGTVFSSNAAQTNYVSTSAVTLPAHTLTGSVPVSAAAPGALGNLAAGAQFTCSPTPIGFIGASNPANFANGLDLETDDQRARRFVQFVSTLSRATVAALEYGATTATVLDSNGNVVEQVKGVSVIEVNLTGLALNANIPPVNIYVHNGVGSTSAALVAQALLVLTGYIDNGGKKIAGWKAAGIPITVAAATEVPINFAGTLAVASGFSLGGAQAAAIAAISGYVLGLNIGQTFVYAEAIFLVMSIPGVTDIALTAPSAADITCAQTQKFMPGTFSLISPSVGSAGGSALVTGAY